MAITPQAPEFTPHAPALGDEGAGCASCRAPLAPDQRYCLNCGRRRAETRVAFLELLRGADHGEAGGGRDRPASPSLPPAIIVGIGVGMVILLLSFGVVLGTIVGGEGGAPAVAPAPSPAEAFTSDWPAGRQGFTVALRTLPKASTDVAAVARAKQQAGSAGAAQVGALDADDHPSLTPRTYIVYSGVFATRKQAAARLEQVKAKFPAARVVQVANQAAGSGGKRASDADLGAGEDSAEVGRDQLDDIERASGDPQRSSKLPKTITIEGEPPPTDNRAPGGGDPGPATEIGP